MTEEPGTQTMDAPVSAVNADGSFVENWHDKFGEENKAHLSRYKTFDDLVNSHVATKKKFGKNPDSLIEIPTEHSSDKVKAAWKKAKGTPDSIDAYEYTLSDEMAVKLGPIDDKKMSAFKEFAHKQEWSPQQFKDALDFYHTNIASEIDAFGELTTKQTAEAAEKARTELKQLWLGEYDTKVQRAQSVMEKYGGVDAVAEANLQNSPKMIKFLDNIAESMSEDTLKGLDASSTVTTANIKTQIAEIRTQMDKIIKENPSNFKGNVEFRDLQKRKTELYKQMKK
ncbi:MAG: hypothetical protein ACYSSI_00060 [Planctomycetota bacterium]|jgi:hypothetical protein